MEKSIVEIPSKKTLMPMPSRTRVYAYVRVYISSEVQVTFSEIRQNIIIRVFQLA
jgi:hypothetical protein